MKPFPAARMRALRNLAHWAQHYRELSPEEAAAFVQQAGVSLRTGDTLHGVYNPRPGQHIPAWVLSAHSLYLHRTNTWEAIPLVDVVWVSAVGRPHLEKGEVSILGIGLANGDAFVLRFTERRGDLWTVFTCLQRLADLDRRDPG